MADASLQMWFGAESDAALNYKDEKCILTKPMVREITKKSGIFRNKRLKNSMFLSMTNSGGNLKKIV